MRRFTWHMVEMAVGALILGLGLYYLDIRDRAAGCLIDIAKGQILERNNLYEQKTYINNMAISAEELYAIIMGYREYPISIDGTVIPPDGTDFTSYFLLIKDGTYNKSFLYDASHNIVQINYTYNNPL